MNDGRHKPEVDDSNMTMLKDENFKVYEHVFRCQKHARAFDNNKESEEVSNALIKKHMLKIARQK